MATGPSPIASSLRQFQLHGVSDTGIIIGIGSYATVKELEFRGLKCAGKKTHDVLFHAATPRDRAAMLQRFTEECELMSRLHHPCVVQFLGVHFEDDSQLPVLVMEFLHTTLSGSLDRYGVLPEAISYGILCDVALGLRYLHEHSPPIVHRDLSANNVLLTSSMSGKISDLGVAKIFNLTPAQMTQTQVPGTPCYMPPEALMARPTYTSKIDSYSYGVMVIHVLCGRWPFPTDPFQIHSDPQLSDLQHSMNEMLIPVAELDRRAEYLQEIGWDHPLMGLISQCLSNAPTRRPEAFEILRQITAIASRVSERHQNKIEMLLNQYWEGRVQDRQAEVKQLSIQSEGESGQACQPQLQPIQLLRSQSLPQLLPRPLSQPRSHLEEETHTLRSELEDKRQEIKDLHHQIWKLKAEKEHLCTEKNLFQNQWQETETQCEELKLCVQENDEELEMLRLGVQEKDEEIDELHHQIWELRADEEHLCTGDETDTEDGNSKDEDVDSISSAQPCSTSAPEEDSRCVSDEGTNPSLWATHTNPKKKWKLQRKLGKGSFGEVYFCHHHDHTTDLAVKIIEVFGNKMEPLNSFTKEVSALKQVSKHNRIVEYVDTDIDVTKGTVWLYIFMEYMPGGTLRHYTQKYGRMELPLVRKCTVQLLEGVAHLHENKIVHRDIKGANILLDSEGNIKLADFGCAKTLENISIDGKMSHEQGTICWRAPETVKKYQEALLYVFESDIWSVGATVIELITGQHPYYPYNHCSVVLILGSEEPDFKTPFDVCKPVISEPDEHMIAFLSHCFRREPSERLSAQKLLQTAKFCHIK